LKTIEGYYNEIAGGLNLNSHNFLDLLNQSIHNINCEN